jgi:NAD(P)-dependent dehydrogenase (short-subunit alcohol dehydrogenase family)
MGLLENKVALITGCTGICQATILASAREGADIAFTYLPTIKADVDAAKKNVEDVTAIGRRALSIAADVRKIDDVKNAVKKTLNEFGKIDVLVNCAGVYTYAWAIETTEEVYNFNMDVNLKGTLLFCQEVAKSAMIPQKKGRIVNIASCVGVMPQDHTLAYSLAKAGVIHLTRNLAREWAQYGIGVNCVSPGFTLTETMKKAIERGDVDEKVLLKMIPTRRFAKPEEIAEAIVWLASDKCPQCTGANLIIDGGMLAGYSPL